MSAATISAEVLGDAITAAHVEATVTNTYSGRGMYGAQCFGITTSSTEMAEIFVALAQIDPVLAKRLTGFTTDSMGLSIIHYWPGLTLDGETGYEESDDWEDDWEDDE